MNTQTIKQYLTKASDLATGYIVGHGLYSRSQQICDAFADYGFHYACVYAITRALGPRGLMIGNTANILFEYAQQYHMIPGTYDAKDIVAGMTGSLVAQLWMKHQSSTTKT